MTMLSHVVLREVGAIARTIQSLCDARYKSLGLQKGQFVFLTRICENPGTNLNRLSSLVNVDKTTTTKAIQKLETLGYVARKVDGIDGRARLISPTPKALGIYELLISDENANLDSCLSGFSPEEITLVTNLLIRIHTNLDRVREMGTADPQSER